MFHILRTQTPPPPLQLQKVLKIEGALTEFLWHLALLLRVYDGYYLCVFSRSRDPSPDARQHLKEWMKEKRSERQAEWKGQQEELRAQEHQPFMSPTQVFINNFYYLTNFSN